jgi:hypothetical protein
MEYVALYVGYHDLILLAAIFYGLAFFSLTRTHRRALGFS